MTSDLITIIYTGPKASKTLELPVGIIRYADIEMKVTFSAGNLMEAEIPAKYVGALVGPGSFYAFANPADRQRFADWVTAFPTQEGEALPPAGVPVIPEPDTQPVTIRPLETRNQPPSHLEDLNIFEELV